VFSNRGYRWKLCGALGVIAMMGVAAALRGDSINPSLWRCVAEPRRWEGASLWFPTARILSVRGSDYDIASGAAQIRVLGRAPAASGTLITLTGTFHADGPRVDPVRTRVLSPHTQLRWLMEAVSIMVALAVLANFARHFLFRPRMLQVGRSD
jgi:hypothetical protein